MPKKRDLGTELLQGGQECKHGKGKRYEITMSSGNVFEDLGIAKPALHLMKADLAIAKKKSSAVKFLEKMTGGPLTFGKMIHSIRICDEISQSKLAEMTNISRSHLRDIEHEKRFVSIEKAIQFAKILGYSKTQFISMAIDDQHRAAGLPFVVELKKKRLNT